MATYAIGDVQGCYDPLRRLLDAIEFDPAKDRLWFVGDLVNRGPKSLKTLRFVHRLGDAAVTVLGNHDLHLLALACGSIAYSDRFSTLKKILDAPDVGELTDWLRHRPLAHYSDEFDTLMVHAGTHPGWTVKKTLARAAEVEGALRGPKYATLLTKMYGNTPRKWSGKLRGWSRLRYIINCLTRMRMVTDKGALNFAHTGSPFRARVDLHPWYELDGAAWGTTRIVFGHWSALGLMALPDLISLDTGCVWGRQLTAVRLDTRIPQIMQVHGQE
ncbi:MAG: symmetrical bis(5'-nucleosyl)-tetraphosphatase [Woeseiaceae bacterium]|nr:symmetrical bis(5'-nucleosyl)-tetraphosphatase [Woeseiaceae bacterium]